jgi:hypothetical protein
LLSSTSYVLNDIIDYQYDRKHPIKKFRPVASGEISIPQATFIVFVLCLLSLIISLFFPLAFFFLALVFILLHFFYSLYLKKFPVVDIFAISFSFMIRTFAGEVITGYHIPIWLLLTIFFVSLFMAAVKRHAELVVQGEGTRESLFSYKEHLLDFLTYTFAAITIIAYANFAYIPADTYIERKCDTQIEQVDQSEKDCQTTPLAGFVDMILPNVEGRKLMMITIPFVVYGVARYAQLLYERYQGERPEKIITTDKPLIMTIFLWALIVVMLIYIV